MVRARVAPCFASENSIRGTTAREEGKRETKENVTELIIGDK